MSIRQVARLIGVSHWQVQELLNNPAAVSNRLVVEQLLTLHENVLTGHNKWGRMVCALTQHGWSHEHIAQRAGVTVHHIQREFGDPLNIPGNGPAEIVEGLYRRHVWNNLRD